MINVIVNFILLPFAVGLYYLAVVIDNMVAFASSCRETLMCLLGNHMPYDRGPHRQECLHCHKHFDIDLMATNLEQNRIGFFEQDIYLGAVGKVNELFWSHELNEGHPNQLADALRTYDILCVMWHDGMYPFRRN